MQTEISDPPGRSNEKDSRKIEQWALAAVLILAAVLRIFRLGQLPNGFSPDEASYGYNGYSLLHTGRDRFGEWLPLFADNFGDLIAASYMWLTVPSIALFGLDEFAVRLPAALVGIATVWVAYKLGTAFYDAWAGLLTALFLAISPWHIQVSRYAERSPLLPLLFCLGLFLFLRWQQKQKKELLWSALAFALCLYSYASARVFVPLYVLGAALIYSSSLWSERRRALVAIFLFVLLALPAVYHWTSAAGMARAHYLLHWEPLEWLLNYCSYFSPNYLFFSGDTNLRHSIRGMGQLHSFEMATVAAGLFFCLRRRSRADALVVLWLLLYPLPALLTEPGHAIRSVVGAPLFALLSGCGLKVIIETFTARRRAVAIGTAALVIAGALGLYGKRYFVDYAEYGATEWMHGVRAAFVEVETHPHTQLYLSDEIFLSHIFALFYTAYPPAQYQRDPLRSVHQGRWNYRRYRFGNNEINNVAKIMQRPCSNSALIAIAGEGRPYVSTSRWQRVQTITVPDGRAALDVFICPE
ncbi:MAG: 4-amino-4-deoxy-L-arabinose transferase-like glycosyltransferase [Candidatus Latescibacterota bacterium]|jgi:4-amino-4-deoxy-L-arabinose transferase-like glycosyltransferase